MVDCGKVRREFCQAKFIGEKIIELHRVKCSECCTDQRLPQADGKPLGRCTGKIEPGTRM